MNISKGAIVSFSKEYRFLSNFFPCIIIKDDIHYSTVEHYYQAMKSSDVNIHKRVAGMLRASEAKKFGRTIMYDDLEWREDWDQVRLKVMTEGLVQKFAPNTRLAEDLKNTDGYLIIEGNTWKDNFWGVDFETGIGENRLGILLMRIREKLLLNKNLF